MNQATFWQRQLDRWINKYHVAAMLSRPGSEVAPVEIRLHVARYTDRELLQTVDQQQRKGIITASDLVEFGPIKAGDRLTYLDQTVTVDNVDPRIEVGEPIGYDLILRGHET